MIQKIDNKGNNAGINNGDMTTNVYYAYNTFNKPLKNYQETIEVSSESVFDKNSFYSKWFLIFILFYGILSLSFSISKNLSAIIFMVFMIFLGYKIYKYGLISSKDNSKLILEDSKLILNNEEIDFINIRSFFKEKFMFSYQFFIYEQNKIKPKIKFSTTSIHTAIAIEELLKFKINEAIELEKSSNLENPKTTL